MENETNQEEIKVAIIRQPKDWLNFFTLSVAIVSLLLSYASFSSVDSQYQQLLPLKEANVSFSEQNIQIIPNAQQNGLTGDGIVPVIINIGQATAKNINFKIYAIPFDGNIAKNLFDDRIAQDLEGGEKISFGSFLIGYKLANGIDASYLKGKEQIALLFRLTYTDSLTNQKHSKVSLFQYVFGTNTIHALLESDYKKIYPTLIAGVTSSSDEILLEYLNDNKPL